MITPNYLKGCGCHHKQYMENFSSSEPSRQSTDRTPLTQSDTERINEFEDIIAHSDQETKRHLLQALDALELLLVKSKTRIPLREALSGSSPYVIAAAISVAVLTPFFGFVAPVVGAIAATSGITAQSIASENKKRRHEIATRLDAIRRLLTTKESSSKPQ